MSQAEEFQFDVHASPLRYTPQELLDNLGEYAESVGFRKFTVEEFDTWPGRRCSAATIIRRFRSWRRALQLIGIEGVRRFKYSPGECMEILEKVWRKIGYPPGRRKLAKVGKISESPYERYWGSVQEACHHLAAYKRGQIDRETLLRPQQLEDQAAALPLRIRWQVLKRDRYRCVKCGRNPATDRNVELQVDHVYPRSKGGDAAIENLQTLCKECNWGKKDET